MSEISTSPEPDESSNYTEIIQPAEQQVSTFDLPTTPELAKVGVRQFREAAKMLSSNKLRRIFLNSKDLKRCFVGTMPEVGIEYLEMSSGLSQDEFGELIRVITEHAPDIRFFRTPENIEGVFHTGNKPGLINMASARIVVQNNSDVFPAEAIIDPDKWLLNNLNEWHEYFLEERTLPGIRLGLLSGFPEWSTKQYKPHNDAIALLDFTHTELPPQSETYLNYYKDGYIEHDEDAKKIVQHVLELAGPSLSAEERTMIINAKAVASEALGGYISFGGLKDDAYINAIDNLYTASGIEDIASEFSADQE